MANISVVELLFDPDFVDQVTVLRNVETVGNDGISTYAEQSISILASIQAQSGDELVMDPDASRTQGTFECITTFPLAAATPTLKADTVIWRGCEYVVSSVGRFGNFAGSLGHYEAIITLKTISPEYGPP